jgi:hypothetical protein
MDIYVLPVLLIVPFLATPCFHIHLFTHRYTHRYTPASWMFWLIILEIDIFLILACA